MLFPQTELRPHTEGAAQLTKAKRTGANSQKNTLPNPRSSSSSFIFFALEL